MLPLLFMITYNYHCEEQHEGGLMELSLVTKITLPGPLGESGRFPFVLLLGDPPVISHPQVGNP